MARSGRPVPQRPLLHEAWFANPLMTSANRGVSHKTVAAWLSVLELLKRRFHQGLAFNLHCWHNNSGEELDVIVEHGQRMIRMAIRRRSLGSALTKPR